MDKKDTYNPGSSSPSTIQDWVSLYADDLYRWAMHKTNDRETSEDLVQETFLAAFKSQDKFQGDSQPKTWLFSILNHKVIDFHRKKFREAVINQSSTNLLSDDADVLDNFFDNEGAWKANASPLNWQEHEEHLLDNEEFKGALQRCMKELPEKWFYAIHFKYLEGKGGQQICQELRITSSNYWKMLQRAKFQLKMCLETNWSK